MSGTMPTPVDPEPTSDAGQADRWIAQTERAARVERTACGSGQLVWRCWGRGEPLVLVHGGGGSWQHWLRNIGPLARQRQVWCPDLPAFGDSADPPAPGGVPEIARALADGLDSLFPDGRALDVAGFSFGGIVSAVAARLRPARIGRLVVVGSAALGLPRPPFEMRVWRKEIDAAGRRAAHLHNLRALMVASRADDALALAIHSRNVERARFNGRATAASTLLRDVLPEVRARVAGIWGSLDATAQPDVRAAEAVMRAAVPAVRFEVIPDAGHWVPYESAARFNAVLADVLES
jgi:pimeloyl-ACP methyl ester carboxylesterase